MAERGLEEPADMSMDNVTNRLTDCHVSQKERLKDTHIDRQTDRDRWPIYIVNSVDKIKLSDTQTDRQTDRQ